MTGVTLRRDIAEPGRGPGLGLGLGGASLVHALAPSLSSCSSSLAASASASALLSVPESPLVVVKSRDANRRDLVAVVVVRASRGVRPDSSTFLRALRPMQSTSCRIASRSETARRGAVRVPVRLSVLGRAPVPVLVPLRRIGVLNSKLAMSSGV